MKRSSMVMMTGLLLSLLAFTFIKSGNIQGKVLPADGALEVQAIMGTDTLRTALNNGSFIFKNIKTGTYAILLKGNMPYKDTTVKNVAVIDSTTTDIGLIRLAQ
uniref:carboxypeptidase regulatory-like domain-containing protein n=1 Tax=Pedobacter schmidteae TaxID=2201271 RepID=UPI000EB014C8|nr:carboxypeptidase regulatory-like domain-containing protein [Pedobacter schmidteae]